MNIVFFHRNPKCGFSISKVFNTITDEMMKKHCIKEYYVPSHRSNLVSILKNIYYVYKYRNKEGINHISGDIHYCLIALLGCKSILTVHDLSAYDHPKNLIKKIIIKWLWFKLPLLIADKVVCISEHTKNELIKMYDRKDIEVIYNAVDPSFIIDKTHIFNSSLPVILHIGTAWNKNLKNTIMATLSMSCHICIVGRVEDSIILFLEDNKISYSIKEGLSDLELLDEYEKSDIVSFCSLYEGFGMPIIEANALGRCVITSNLSPMNEIANDSACFVNPLDVASIEHAFKKVIFDRNYRDNLIEKGKINVERFKVKKTVGSYEKLYSQVL